MVREGQIQSEMNCNNCEMHLSTSPLVFLSFVLRGIPLIIGKNDPSIHTSRAASPIPISGD